MNDSDKTKEQLIEEVAFLRRRLQEMEALLPQMSGDDDVSLQQGGVMGLPDELSDAEKSLFSRYSVEVSADEVFWMREDSSIIYVNESACSRLGYSCEELRKMHVWDWDPLFQKDIWEDFSLEMQDVKTKTFETKHRTRSGEVFPVEITVNQLEYSGGRVFFAFVHDISERQNLLDRLRSQHARFEAIFNSIGDGIVFVDTDQRIVMTNPGFAKLTGFAQDEVVGQHMLFGSDEEKLTQPWKSLFDLGGDEVVPEMYARHCNQKDGTPFICDVFSEPVTDTDGNIIGEIKVFRDVTERVKIRKELDEKRAMLLAAIDNMDYGMMMTDSTGKVIDFNDAWVRLCHFESRKECYTHFNQYAACAEVFDADGNSCPPEEWATSRALRGESGKNVEYSIQAGKRGLFYTASFSYNPVRNDQGDIVGSMVIAYDITEQKEKEAAERLSEERLEQSRKLEAIGTLAAGIAHDFNNILGAIRGYADMAQCQTSSDPHFSNNLDQIIIAADRATDLVKQILLFSRQTKLKPRPLRITPLVKEGVKMLRSFFPSTISIVEDIDIEDDIIQADPTQLHQVLINLCTNASHAMDDSRGTLTVELKKCALNGKELKMIFPVQAGEYVRLTITDSGTGIAPDIVDRIFDPYFSTKDVGKGTGMGLAIVYGIVKECGGTIVVDTLSGKGTSFHVYLPLVDAEIPEEKSGVSDLLPGTEHILFVDDDPILIELAKSMLEHLGYRATVVQDSLQAMELLKNNLQDFDLVITDQTMPGMTGLELVRNLRQSGSDIPVILCSGYSELLNESSVQEAKINEFILKPMNITVLSHTLRKVLDHQQTAFADAGSGPG